MNLAIRELKFGTRRKEKEEFSPDKSFLVASKFLDLSDLSNLSKIEVANVLILESCLKDYAPDFMNSVLIKSGLISKEDFLQMILWRDLSSEEKTTKDIFPDYYQFAILFSTRPEFSEKIQKLIDLGYLNKTNINFLLKDATFYDIVTSNKYDLVDLIKKGFIDVAKFNRINYGLVKVPEHEAFWADRTLKDTSRYGGFGKPSTLTNYPHKDDQEMHPLQTLTRNTEHRSSFNRQIEKVLGKSMPDDIFESIDVLFNYYSRESDVFGNISNMESVAPEVRRQNAIDVNSKQILKVLSKNTFKVNLDYLKSAGLFNYDERSVDIYARYQHGQMDPFQLAIITKTIDWYVKSGKSKLFSNVRFVPRRINNTSIPWMIAKIAKASRLLPVSGMNFILSNLCSNRFYLTHSSAEDSQDMFSIPIFSKNVYADGSKYSFFKPFVVMDAKFDSANDLNHGGVVAKMKDKFRGYFKGNADGEIAKLINETLRCLLEAEKLELARVGKSF